jgi:hypothetical protein
LVFIILLFSLSLFSGCGKSGINNTVDQGSETKSLSANSTPVAVAPGYGISLVTGAVDGPFGMFYDRNRDSLIVAQRGDANYLTGTKVMEVKPNGTTTTLYNGFGGTADVRYAPDGFGIYGGNLFVAEQLSGIVSVVRNNTKEFFYRTGPYGGKGPTSLAFSPPSFGAYGNQLFAVYYEGGQVIRIDQNKIGYVFANYGLRAISCAIFERLKDGVYGRLLLTRERSPFQREAIDAAGNKSVFISMNENTVFMDYDDDFNLYVMSYTKLYKIDQNKNVTVIADGFIGGVGIAYDGKGNLYVGDTGADKIWRIYKTEVEISADCDPDTLNIASRGGYITCYLETPSGYNVRDIVVSSISIVALNDVNIVPIRAESKPTAIGDGNNNGVQDLMVKFSRQVLINRIQRLPGTNNSLKYTIKGTFTSGLRFVAKDTVRLISTR